MSSAPHPFSARPLLLARLTHAHSPPQESRYLRNEVGVLKENVREVNRKIDSMAVILQQLAGLPPSPPSQLNRRTTQEMLTRRSESGFGSGRSSKELGGVSEVAVSSP